MTCRQGWLLAIVLLVLPCVARAQAPDAQTRKSAVRLLQEGIDRFDAGAYEAALARFQAAYALVPSPKIFLNIGNTLRKLKRDSEAAQAYEQFLEGESIDPRKRLVAEEELADLRRRLARVSIEQPVPETVLTLDGRTIVPPERRPLYVEPGPHKLRATAPGYEPKVFDLDAQAGRSSSLVVDLERFKARPVVVLRAPVLRADPNAGRAKRVTGLILGGIGIAAVAAGVYFGLAASSKSDELASAFDPPRPWRQGDAALQEEQQSLASRATLLLSVGSGAVLVGGLLYYWGYRDARAPILPVAVGAMPGGASVAWSGRF